MSVFKIECGQRGCICEVEADGAPELCPVCNNPLLEGNVVEKKEESSEPETPAE